MTDATPHKEVVHLRDYALFQDTRVPYEYLQNFRRTIDSIPEQRLMLAVLEDAVQCFQKHLLASSAKGRLLFAEAEAWFSESDSVGVFSFENVCAELGITPICFRKRLFDWKAHRMHQLRRAKTAHGERLTRHILSH